MNLPIKNELHEVKGSKKEDDHLNRLYAKLRAEGKRLVRLNDFVESGRGKTATTLFDVDVRTI